MGELGVLGESRNTKEQTNGICDLQLPTGK